MMMGSDPEKERFLNQFGQDYGYPNAPKNIDEIRATEFKRLNDVVYLDHAGATLYSESQLEAVFKDLNSTLYGNPHSQSNCSFMTSNIVDEARYRLGIIVGAVVFSIIEWPLFALVLKFFNASPGEYRCVFTSGATAALKLVGETFPWSSKSTFMYTVENHNSVLGIREYALSKGAASIAADIEDAAEKDLSNINSPIKIIPRCVLTRDEGGDRNEDQTGDAYNLFAFPSECNFSGLRFNLDLVNIIKEDPYATSGSGRWLVLIDAAKGSATSPPDLSNYKADFVVVSFYKLFGYPTGLGALIVRNEPAKLLKKTYFSGGTVAASIADIDFYRRRDGIEEYFEDGTLPFLSIASLHHGFRILDTLTMSSISRHTMSLSAYVRGALLKLRHANGNRVCTLYGLNDKEMSSYEMGPVISFNLKRPDGSWFGYREVEKLASLSSIQLRTGCFCNPGACAKHLGLSYSDILSNVEAGHVCWDDHDVLHGKPTGAVRISFGYMSTIEDAKKFLKFVENEFVALPTQPAYLSLLRANSLHPASEGIERNTARYFLKSIVIYPIKSCAGFSVESWPLSSTGLLHDREWLLRSLTGEILTQKKVPEMSFISTWIDLKAGLLVAKSPRCKDELQIDLISDPLSAGKEVVNIYSQRYEVQCYQNEVDIWFSNAVGRPCTLLRSSASGSYVCSNGTKGLGTCRDVETRLNFVNESQFLLVSEESVADLNNRLRSKRQNCPNELPVEVTPVRFRPNLVFCGGEPYSEDSWGSLKIGDTKFTLVGGCNRCQMINMTPKSGKVQRSSEPLATLASYRRIKGKIYFGVMLKLHDSIQQDTWLRVGEEIIADAG